MEQQPTVTVRGEAVLEVDPELAIITVSVTGRDRDRRQALTHLDERRREVQRILDSHAAAIEKIEGGAIAVHPEFKDRKRDERVASYVATSHMRIKVQDFSALEALVTSLADQELATVDGPDWALRPTSPSIRAARLAAVQDAIRSAKDYAEALGAQVTELLELADAGLLTQGSGGPQRTYMAASAGRSRGDRGGEPVEFDFAPEPQTVRGQVDARFGITTPSID
jgi:uncharacterized protein YggE